jgi:hypothetical protein
MSTAVLVFALVFLAGTRSVLAETADRGGGDQQPQPEPTVDTDGDIEARVGYNGVIFTVGGGGGPTCTWRHMTTGEYEDFFDLVDEREPPPLPEVPELPTDREPTEEEVEAHRRASEELDAEVERRRVAAEAEARRRAQPSTITSTELGEEKPHRVFSATCPGTGFFVRFIADTTDEDELLFSLEDIVEARIEAPIPDINPPVDVGGVVNLGMWMAITPQDPIPNITAEAGPHWVTVSPRHTSVTFTMGDGSPPIVCTGTGDPIPDSEIDNAAASPICGHTYSQSSFDDAPYQLEIGTTWSIPYTSSSGSGDIGPYTRTETFAYDVDEIQTVGTS